MNRYYKVALEVFFIFILFFSLHISLTGPQSILQFRARLTDRLHQRKRSFGAKIVLSGEDVQWRISTEKAWIKLFLHLT